MFDCVEIETILGSIYLAGRVQLADKRDLFGDVNGHVAPYRQREQDEGMPTRAEGPGAARSNILYGLPGPSATISHLFSPASASELK